MNKKEKEVRKNLTNFFAKYEKLFTKYYDHMLKVTSNDGIRKVPLNMIILEFAVTASQESKQAIIEFLNTHKDEKYEVGSGFDFMCRLIETDNFFYSGKHNQILYGLAASCFDKISSKELVESIMKRVEEIGVEQNTSGNTLK